MARLVFAPLAEQDLDDILAYIGRDKPGAAVKWVQKIRKKCALLADNPEIGERRPESRPANSGAALSVVTQSSIGR